MNQQLPPTGLTHLIASERQKCQDRLDAVKLREFWDNSSTADLAFYCATHGKGTANDDLSVLGLPRRGESEYERVVAVVDQDAVKFSTLAVQGLAAFSFRRARS